MKVLNLEIDINLNLISLVILEKKGFGRKTEG